MTYEEIEDLDAGSSFGKGYQGEKIPTLDEVLNFCLGRLDLNIEIKYNGKNKGIVQRVIQVIRENHFEEHCVVTSMNYRFLEEIKETAPEIRTGYIMTMNYGSISQVTAADFFQRPLRLCYRRLCKGGTCPGKRSPCLDGKLQGKYKADAGYGSR